MAIGDAADAAGYPLVPETGDAGRVRWGAQEINRTRDMVAQLGTKLTKSGTAVPTGGVDGDVYWQIV